MERIPLKLIGEDGNIFNLLAVVRHELSRLKRETGNDEYDKLWQTVHDDVTSSESYADALQVLIKYFDIE